MPKTRTRKNRREFLKLSAGLIGLGLVQQTLSDSEKCGYPTPDQIEGPFYPAFQSNDTDWDLTQTQGKPRTTLGHIILVDGIVQDETCQPVENCMVEIWQACASGRYNHRRDDSDNLFDPNFQYWGIAKSDSKGHYLFQTIVPGHYAVTESWTRPPHIHFKVYKQGYLELTTQLYFRDHPLNENDLILQGVPDSTRDRVIRPLMPLSPVSVISNTFVAQQRIVFDIQIEGV